MGKALATNGARRPTPTARKAGQQVARRPRRAGFRQVGGRQSGPGPGPGEGADRPLPRTRSKGDPAAVAPGIEAARGKLEEINSAIAGAKADVDKAQKDVPAEDAAE